MDLNLLFFFLPLGIVGVWRWGTWLIKKIIGWFYRPTTGNFKSSVSIVTPVYNEVPAVFRAALESWKKNNPDEIIAVIDASDKNCINEFNSFSNDFAGTKLIITEKPGKRPALADGIKAAAGPIVALIDSDVMWADDVLKICLRPFSDPKVAGVGARQNVQNPKTLAEKIFDIQLDLRFYDDMLPSATAGSAFTCLSGRTAFYRREVILPMMDDLVNEKFWGKQCIGGDDKRLTYLVESAGWKCRYQHNARVYTTGAATVKTLFNQRLRWARNTWRADLRAISQGWPFKHPFLTFILFDRTISNFTLLLSLIYFIISLILQLWIPAAIIIVWWLFSRSLRIMPNLLNHPGNITLIPHYIATNFAGAILRIYALLTLNRQDWITRGAKHKPGNAGLWLARAGTLGILVVIGVAVYYSRFTH